MRRDEYCHQIDEQFAVHSIVALLGPRQAGKTTLAKAYIEHSKPKKILFFDLENPIDLARLDNPMLALANVQETLIVIDEIQLRPHLFPVLRFLVDTNASNRFSILGSASRDLIRQSSESLAGRIGYIEVMPFSLSEVTDIEKLWVRGGFPRSFLAENEERSFLWRQAYITSYLERDIPQLGIDIPPQQMRRFWLMLSAYHGQIFNGSEIGKSLGVSHHTSRKYLDILVGTFMVRLLSPWFENISKRQVKSPKIYFRDSGILHALLGLKDLQSLQTQPRLGAFWEGFALEEIIRSQKVSAQECFFWATQAGAELDLLLLKEGKKIGFEVKYADAPKLTASMKIACQDLNLDHLYVIYPGTARYQLDTKITVCGLQDYGC